MGADRCRESGLKVLSELFGALHVSAEAGRNRGTSRCKLFRYGGADPPGTPGDQRHPTDQLRSLRQAGRLLGNVDGGGFAHGCLLAWRTKV